jgi:hypothetical protein
MYDSTGLIRVHKLGVEPLIGPSGVSAIDDYPVAIGLGWPREGKNSFHDLFLFFTMSIADKWEYLAQFGSGAITHTLLVEEQNDDVVRFVLSYSVLGSSVKVTERYPGFLQ